MTYLNELEFQEYSDNGFFVNDESLININSLDTDVIQEITIMILHSAVDYLEKNI